MADNRLEFTFHQCLGKGGFGEVYLATVRRPGGLSRRMAVKVLKEGLDNAEEAVLRLRDEGRMLAILNHPAILRAHDLCRIQGRIALVTEYVEGIDMSKCAKADRLLPKRVVVNALGEVAGALEVAWNTTSPETGNPLHLIHRDIKPENIRLTVHGQVKLLDFGIARSSEMLRHAQTRVGDLPFTPGYAAPESYRRGEQGPASDVYALGVTMYRLLVGERLYEGMDVGAQFEVASLREVYDPWLADRLEKLQVPDSLFDLVARMLAYEIPERPTAKQVREICEDVAEDLGGPSLAKWARSVQFPTPRDVPGASLTGKSLREDAVGTETSEGQTPVRADAPAARTSSMPAAPATRSPTAPAPPPPIPLGLGGSVKPNTATDELIGAVHSGTPPGAPRRAATPVGVSSRSIPPTQAQRTPSVPAYGPPPVARHTKTATPRPSLTPSPPSRDVAPKQRISPLMAPVQAGITPPPPPVAKPRGFSPGLGLLLVALGGVVLLVFGLAAVGLVLWGIV